MSLSKIIYEKIEKELNSEIELLNNLPITVLGVGNISEDLVKGTETGIKIALKIVKNLLIEEETF